MTTTNPLIIGRVNRLRVFAAVKAHMEATGECPLATDIAKAIGISATAVQGHMKGLVGATGLPVPIVVGQQRHGDAQAGQPKDAVSASTAARVRFRSHDHGPVPVDVLFE